MSRIYAVKLSARTRGARWRTVTLDTRITASSMHVAASRAVKATENRTTKLGAMTLHLEEIGKAPSPMTQRDEDEAAYQRDVVGPAVDQMNRR